MANDVVNSCYFECHPKSAKLIREEVTKLVSELREGLEIEASAGTEWRPRYGEPLRFISAWQPDFVLQDCLLARLAEIDRAIVVVLAYAEEFDSLVGVRLATQVNGHVRDAVEEVGLSDATLPGGRSAYVNRINAVINECLGKARLKLGAEVPSTLGKEQLDLSEVDEVAPDGLIDGHVTFAGE